MCLSFPFLLVLLAYETIGFESTAEDASVLEARVVGLISKFEFGCGRTGSDRQFFYVNGRPWAGSKARGSFLPSPVFSLKFWSSTPVPFIGSEVVQ